MKKLAALILLSLPFYIQAKEMKIGFIDSERVFQEYQATAAAKAEYNEFVTTYRDSAAQLKQNIEQLRTELEAQKLVLSEEARLRKLDEIESLNKAYNQYLQDIFGANGRIEQKNDELMSPVLKKINEAVAKIAEQENFTAVLDLSDNVFYASSELDITDLVISELNLEYGTQTLPPGETKKAIVIFPFREENSQAQNADLGPKCQDELYKAISTFSQKYTIKAKNEVNTEIVARGYGRNVEDSQAKIIASYLLCDYYVIGTVKKLSTKIEYKIYLKDVTTNKEVGSRSSSISEDIKLPESLNNDLRGLLEKIQ
jgi:outer membrane protein